MILLLANLVDIACTINEVYWLWRFVDLFFDGRTKLQRRTGNRFFSRKGLVQGIQILIPVTVTMILNQFRLVSSYTFIVILVLCTLMVYICWKCDFVNAVAVVGAYLFVLAAIGGIEVSLTGMLGGETLVYQTTAEQGWVRILYQMICGPIWYGFCFLIFSGLKKWKVMRSYDIKSFAYISILWWLGFSYIFQQMVLSFDVYINTAWYLFLGIIFGAICFTYALIKGKQM